MDGLHRPPRSQDHNMVGHGGVYAVRRVCDGLGFVCAVQGPPTPSMSVSAPHTSQHANNADQKLDADVPMGDNVKALPAQAASSPYNSTIPLRARYTTVRSSLPSLNPCEMFFTTAVESEDKPFIEGYLQVCLAGTVGALLNFCSSFCRRSQRSRALLA